MVPANGANAATAPLKPWPLAAANGMPVTVSTTWVMALEVLPRKLLSPPYTAVMLWLPAVKPSVANVAWSAPSVPVPSVVLPSRKVTVPEE